MQLVRQNTAAVTCFLSSTYLHSSKHFLLGSLAAIEEADSLCISQDLQPLILLSVILCNEIVSLSMRQPITAADVECTLQVHHADVRL